MHVRNWIVAVAVISGACGTGEPVSAPTGGAEQAKVLIGLIVVEEVEVRVDRTSPVRVVARVRGFLPDPCWTQTFIDQQWHGPWVNVWIVMERPAAAQCPQVIQHDEQEIEIPGIVGPGTYYIRVNGEGREIRI